MYVCPPQCRQKKNIVKETNQKQLEVLREMSSWCLQDLGSSSNRTKVCTPSDRIYSISHVPSPAYVSTRLKGSPSILHALT